MSTESSSSSSSPEAQNRAEAQHMAACVDSPTHSESPPQTEAADCRFDRVEQGVPGDDLTSNDVEGDIKALRKKAVEASVAIARGAEGPIDLGKWPRDTFNRLLNVIPRTYRLQWRAGSVFFFGDPSGPHEQAIAEFADSVTSYLNAALRIFECRSTAVEFEEGQLTLEHGLTVKEPDGAWQMSIGGAIDTVLEMVWANETLREFEAELRVWHSARRNVIGLKVWWEGQSGSRALDSERTLATDAFQCCSILMLAQETAWLRPKAWRIGDEALNATLQYPVDEQAGSLALLPSSWFTASRRVPEMIPIFLFNIQLRVGGAIQQMAGGPPISISDSKVWVRERVADEVEMLSTPLPGLAASTRTRLLTRAQEKLALFNMSAAEEDDSEDEEELGG